jgi:hypothetical protein
MAVNPAFIRFNQLMEQGDPENALAMAVESFEQCIREQTHEIGVAFSQGWIEMLIPQLRQVTRMGAPGAQTVRDLVAKLIACINTFFESDWAYEREYVAKNIDEVIYGLPIQMMKLSALSSSTRFALESVLMKTTSKAMKIKHNIILPDLRHD